MEDLTVFGFDDLSWHESPNIHTALIHDVDDNALILDITEDHVNACLLYHPAVKYKNKLHKLPCTVDLGVARWQVWMLYRKLIGRSEPSGQAPVPLDNIYIVTGCTDGFVDELELLP